MPGVFWLALGAVIGTSYGAVLWWAVGDLSRASQARPLGIVLLGAVVRPMVVAVLGLVVFRHAFTAGLCALCGFLAARSIWCGWVMRRVGNWPRPLTD